MADLRALKPVKDRLSDAVAKDLREAVEDAIAKGATGFYLVFENAEELEMRARINAPRIREFLGFTEATLKPSLIGLLNG